MICAHCGVEKPTRELRSFPFYGKGAKVCRDLDDQYLDTASCAARWRKLQRKKELDSVIDVVCDGIQKEWDYLRKIGLHRPLNDPVPGVVVITCRCGREFQRLLDMNGRDPTQCGFCYAEEERADAGS